jgi:hypothetical protein
LVGYRSDAVLDHQQIDLSANVFPSNARLEVPAANGGPAEMEYVFDGNGILGVAQLHTQVTFVGTAFVRNLADITSKRYRVGLQLRHGGFTEHSGVPPTLEFTGDGSAGNPYRVTFTGRDTWGNGAPREDDPAATYYDHTRSDP